MSKKKKRQRSNKSTPSPNPGKVARRLTMETEGKDKYRQMEDMCPSSVNSTDLLKEVSEQLKYLTTKVEGIDRKQDRILARVEKMETLVGTHEKVIKEMNRDITTLKESFAEISSKVQEEFNPEVTLVAINPPHETGNDYYWAVKLIQVLGGDREMIVNTLRTPRRNGKSGILKVELRSTADKIMLLKNKTILKRTQGFERVFVRSSKTHLERLMDLNFRTVLAEIPQGTTYKITGNGRIVKQNEDYIKPTKANIGPNKVQHESAVTDVKVPENRSPHNGVRARNVSQNGQLPPRPGSYHRVQPTQKTPPPWRQETFHETSMSNSVPDTMPMVAMQQQQPVQVGAAAYQYTTHSQHLQGTNSNRGPNDVLPAQGQSHSMMNYLSANSTAIDGQATGGNGNDFAQSQANIQNGPIQSTFYSGQSLTGM